MQYRSISESVAKAGMTFKGHSRSQYIRQRTYVNWISKFCVPWAVNLEQFAINSAKQQFVAESVQGSAKDYLFGRGE